MRRTGLVVALLALPRASSAQTSVEREAAALVAFARAATDRSPGVPFTFLRPTPTQPQLATRAAAIDSLLVAAGVRFLASDRVSRGAGAAVLTSALVEDSSGDWRMLIEYQWCNDGQVVRARTIAHFACDERDCHLTAEVPIAEYEPEPRPPCA